LLREPDSTGAGFSLGPRSIVPAVALEGSGLLEPGSLYETEYRVLLPPGSDLDRMRAEAETAFEGAGMRWRDSRSAAPGAKRVGGGAGSFLVLVGQAGVAVGGVGISAVVRAWWGRKTETTAAQEARGATGGLIRRVFLVQLAALTAVGVVLGLNP